MVFLAGAIAGGVLGLVAGALLQRRAGRSSFVESRGVATTIALIALLVAAGALAAGARDREDSGGSVPAASATTATRGNPGTTSAFSTTTSVAAVPTGLVTVPNVSHPPLSRKDAVAILKRAHLEVSIESLALSNVPPGYVLSQNPLPEAKTTAGSTVTLVVSAAA